MQFPTFVYFGHIIFLFTSKPTRVCWLISSEKGAAEESQVSQYLPPTEIVLISAPWVQPVHDWK